MARKGKNHDFWTCPCDRCVWKRDRITNEALDRAEAPAQPIIDDEELLRGRKIA